MSGSDWIEHSREASRLMSQGHATEAVAIYQKIALSQPRVPEVHNNLAVALKASGLVKEALKSYRKAIKINPEYVIARKNLARALHQLNRVEEALEQYSLILKKKSYDAELLVELSSLLAATTFIKPSFIARSLFLFLFDQDCIDLQKLSSSALSLVNSSRRFVFFLNAAETAYGNKTECCFLTPKTINDALLINILTWTIVPSQQIECWITVARQQLLSLIDNSDNIDADDRLLWAIALQCHATEFVFSATQWEEETTRRISENILNLSHKQIAIIAMYLPIGSLKVPHDFWQKIALLENTPPGLKLLIERDVLDPSTQAKLSLNIARLNDAEDPVSQRVMQQYELNPYPRWLSLDREKTTQSLRERLKNQFPVRYTDSLNLDKPEIMIAGCGTGRHAISTANRYAGSNVLAIDLSLQSLSYAVMQAKKLGQSNIKFAQGDILNLDKLDHRFDLIESSGVLHHMKDPLAGWTTLRNLLKRGGLMRVGLYSSKGRREWNGLREVVPPNLDKERVANFIRERRSRVLMKSVKGVDNVITNIADYYSLSGCRDLLFHENEIQFSIPQITKIIADLNLRFLGFANLMESTEKTFKNKFNSSTDYYDLEKWDIFEQEYPNTFISMYQFWCQAKD